MEGFNLKPLLVARFSCGLSTGVAVNEKDVAVTFELKPKNFYLSDKIFENLHKQLPNKEISQWEDFGQAKLRHTFRYKLPLSGDEDINYIVSWIGKNIIILNSYAREITDRSHGKIRLHLE